MSVRKIVFAGLDTLASGIRIDSEKSETTGAEVGTAEENISYKVGGIIYPTGRGLANLTYVLILHDEQGRGAVEAKARMIENTFYGVKGDLIDSDNPGQKYTNAVFVGSDPLKPVSRNWTSAYMTIHFKADPVPQDINAINERVLKFSANGNAAINITNNASYTITKSGSTSEAVSYTAAEPYTYLLVAVTENAETITLNGAELTPDTPFTMPASAEIAISHTGYGYYELWHDTREAVST
ncbi:MAG: hypothetical protein IJG87_03740 [Ruminococcus sp.]|nr:hypothetical protein [Ruminococcus sp.]